MYTPGARQDWSVGFFHSGPPGRFCLATKPTTRRSLFMPKGICERKLTPVEDRFWDKVNKNGPIPKHRPELGSCWIWIGRRESQGYGTINSGDKRLKAHRVAWFIKHGKMPEGELMHHCDNPPCVRYGHLKDGTHTDNMRDSASKGRNGSSKKTHCPKGHPYEGDNLIINYRGRRVCKSCSRIASLNSYRRKNNKPSFEECDKLPKWIPAKLSESQVLEIRRVMDSKNHPSAPSLCVRFGVTSGTLYHIRDRRTWKHLPEEKPQ